jgi:hypothetical protein
VRDGLRVDESGRTGVGVREGGDVVGDGGWSITNMTPANWSFGLPLDQPRRCRVVLLSGNGGGRRVGSRGEKKKLGEEEKWEL